MKPRILIITNLYPNSREPVKGLYIKQLVDYLRADYEIRVIAPLPWLPGWVATRWRPAMTVPLVETVDGMVVYHPRYLVIPKVLRFTHGFTFAQCIRRSIRALRGDFAFELISVHWMFPDVFGTVLAAKALPVPVVAHALGCDVNDYLKYPLRRRMIRWALLRASAVVAKSEEIAAKVRALGVDSSKVEAIHNGVDRELFRVREKFAQRAALMLPTDKKIILFVGNFAVEKGINFLLEAAAQLREARGDFMLCMIGDGPLRSGVEAKLRELGIAGFTSLLGSIPHRKISCYLNAADVLCLPSLREGCPNVVLESLASGTPVVASAVGAIPEMMARSRIGFMTEPGNVAGLTAMLDRAMNLPEDIDRSFDWPTWKDNAGAVSDVFARQMAAALRHDRLPAGDQPAA
jgi:teichuronic acid biosynthesis glycosyltransferase TuaC